MANAIYPKFKEALISGGSNTDLTTEDVKCVLVDLADYTYSAADEFLDDIAAGARVATSGNLASKTVTDGAFDFADFTFSSVSGDEAEAVVFYVDTGVEATSRLIAILDTGQTGLPITPNGSDIDVVVPAGGAFAL